MSLVPIVDVSLSARVYIYMSLVPVVDVFTSARVYVCLLSLGFL